MILQTKELDDFIKETDKYLLCPKSTKQKFLSDLRNDIYEYAESNEITSIDKVYTHYGKPDVIAKGFNDGIDSKHLKKAVNWKRIIIIGIVIAIVLLSIYLIVSFIDGHPKLHGYSVTSGITIIETTETTMNGGLS